MASKNGGLGRFLSGRPGVAKVFLRPWLFHKMRHSEADSGTNDAISGTTAGGPERYFVCKKRKFNDLDYFHVGKPLDIKTANASFVGKKSLQQVNKNTPYGYG